MSYWVNVKATSVKDVMVEIEDNEDEEAAIETAKIMMNDYESFESEIITSEFVGWYTRRADEVFKLHVGKQ